MSYNFTNKNNKSFPQYLATKKIIIADLKTGDKKIVPQGEENPNRGGANAPPPLFLKALYKKLLSLIHI